MASLWGTGHPLTSLCSPPSALQGQAQCPTYLLSRAQPCVSCAVHPRHSLPMPASISPSSSFSEKVHWCLACSVTSPDCSRPHNFSFPLQFRLNQLALTHQPRLPASDTSPRVFTPSSPRSQGVTLTVQNASESHSRLCHATEGWPVKSQSPTVSVLRCTREAQLGVADVSKLGQALPCAILLILFIYFISS